MYMYSMRRSIKIDDFPSNKNKLHVDPYFYSPVNGQPEPNWNHTDLQVQYLTEFFPIQPKSQIKTLKTVFILQQ